MLRFSPDRTLILAASGESWSTRSIDRLSQSWGERLDAIPQIKGRLVGFSLPNGADWMALFVAILRAGGVALPLDPGSDVANHESTVQSVGGVALIDRAGLKFWKGTAHALPPEICLAKLTSGSTGQPRRFCFSHAEMEADGCQVQRGMGIGADDVNLAVIPFGHSYGLGNFVMPLLRSGTAVALGRSILPRDVVADLEATSATVFPAVPPLIHALATADLPVDRLGQIRLVISAGGRLPGQLAQRFGERFNLPVCSFYGSTETGGITFDRRGADSGSERSVGKPLPGVNVVRSRTGRLLVTSRAVYSHGNRRRTDSGTGCVLLSDYGRILDDGAVALGGRRRGFIKKAGRRISLAEVETVARALPGVRQAWASGSNPAGSEESIGLVVETDLTAEVIRSGLKKNLPKWKRPTRIVCLGRFPTTIRGKFATKELERYLTSRSW